jgi:hypothetical protein
MADWTSLLNGLNATVLGTFGREVVYSPQTGAPSSIRTIIETARETEDATPGVYALLFLRLGDLPRPPERGDMVAIEDISYKVFDIEADGGGGAVLRLRQV